MFSYTEEIQKIYPTRKTAKEKRDFRRYLLDNLRRMGYETREEQGGSAVNVVAGDPRAAAYLVTANYDTPSASIFPAFASATSVPLYVLWQAVTAAVMIAACFVVSIGISFALQAAGLAFPLFCVLVALLIVLARYGPGRKKNANVNTSGLGTALDIARDLPKEAQGKVAFVFFDQGESGMGGSAAYRKAHKGEVNEQVVFHFYAVGEGDELLLLPSNRQRWDGDASAALERAVQGTEKKRVKVIEKGLVYYPSDQRRFRFSYLVGAFRKNPVLGYYRFRRVNDNVCDGENVETLRRGFIKFFEE